MALKLLEPEDGLPRPWLLDQVPSYQGAFADSSASDRGDCAVGLPKGRACPSTKELASFLTSIASQAGKAVVGEAVIHCREARVYQAGQIQDSDCFHYLTCAGQRCQYPVCLHQHLLRFFEEASRLFDGHLETQVASSCLKEGVL